MTARRPPRRTHSRPLPRLLLLLSGWLSILLGAGPGGMSPAFGQADSLAGLARQFASYGQRVPDEKLFLHLDRPAYVSGETVWLAVYATEGSTHRPLPVSSVAYVEVLNAAQKPVLQAKIGLRDAAGQGSLELPATLASGRYTVRAYTGWMQNFGPEMFFQSPITIVNPRRPLARPAARPTPPAAAYDPQFFPEGGYLVQGLSSQVGFKITDSAGRGVAAEGVVLDQAGASVAQFRTLRFGLGSFSLLPTKAGAAYTAVIKLANQQTITCALPPVREQGYVLRLIDTDPQVLRILVKTRGAELANETVFLLGHAGQQVLVAAGEQLFDGQVAFTVPRQKLAAGGVSHFTLFNSRRQPVCERLYFRPPTQRLALTARTDQRQYGLRAPVSLQLSAAGPAPARLSVAVYQLDSLAAGGGADIGSYFGLTSDLKGTVESPAYYLSATGPEAAQAADNLMLTQGWSRWRWADVLRARPDSLPHLPEPNGPLLRGRVLSRGTGAPAPNIPIYLATPSRHVQLYTAVSRRDGSVQVELPDFYGARQLIVQPDTQRDSLYQVELFSSFAGQPATGRLAGPLALSEDLAASLRRRLVQMQVQPRYFGGPAARYDAPRTDSAAFFGRPDEHYRLDDYTRFKVMEEVMREYVPGVVVRRRPDGFHFLVPDKNSKNLLDGPLVLLDGVPVFDTDRIMAFDPLKVQQLDVITTRYALGARLYNGVVSYTTYQGDLAGFTPDPHALLTDYEGLQGQREFYAPRYDTPLDKQSRRPDLRNLLYWNPAVRPTPGTGAQLTFFTSDQAGTYRVVVQGLTENGLAGSTSFDFEVKSAL
ncbi:hypothetical protein [uncultured Hymenobacter sp.]|uniref:hypothetical protein n=1 Tax=uncultured Hymenobacter sp. TaxID=170016 RepID=UPI0035CA12C4